MCPVIFTALDIGCQVKGERRMTNLDPKARRRAYRNRRIGRRQAKRRRYLWALLAKSGRRELAQRKGR